METPNQEFLNQSVVLANPFLIEIKTKGRRHPYLDLIETTQCLKFGVFFYIYSYRFVI